MSSFGTVLIVNKGEENDNSSHMSSIIILTMGVFSDIDRDEFFWLDNDVYYMVKSCKKNSLETHKQHGIKGFVYWFGDKDVYGN